MSVVHLVARSFLLDHHQTRNHRPDASQACGLLQLMTAAFEVRELLERMMPMPCAWFARLYSSVALCAGPTKAQARHSCGGAAAWRQVSTYLYDSIVQQGRRGAVLWHS